MSRLCLVLLTVLTCGLSSAAADWPQYLGPQRNATSTETGLLRAWPAEGPKVLWRVALGEGFGAPAISDGKVYLLDRIGTEKDALRCFDLTDGKQLWSYEYDAPGKTSFAGSRAVPTIDENFVFTCGPFGDVYCFDRNTQQPVWHKNVWKDFGGEKAPTWALAQNPLVYGDHLILAAQTGQVGLVAYEKATGEVAWTSPPLPGRLGYVSPTLVKIDGEEQLVMVTAGSSDRSGSGRSKSGRSKAGGSKSSGAKSDGSASGSPGAVVGLDPKSGRMLWSYEGWQCKIPVPNVTDIGDGRLLIAGGYRAGAAMIRIEKSGNSFRATEVFKTGEFGTHVHPAILHEGHLYAQNSNNETRDGLVCMDLEGNVKWKTGREPTFDKGGMILADGMILSADGSEMVYLIEPSPEGFKPLASAKLLETKLSWAPLALSDGKLLVRDQGQMKCVAVR
ncbi:MAG: PQQ-binding-like beta-propeller repeat protein [Planctomycetota bacterium]